MTDRPHPPAQPLSPWGTLAAALLIIGLAVFAYWLVQPQHAFVRTLGDRSAHAVDVQRPHLLIESQSLAALPRDLLAIPVLGDILTEDFVDYYAHQPDRLGIAGALKRLAFEHRLDWRDSLLNALLDEPATVALWIGADGRPRHAIALIRQHWLADLLMPLLTVAMNDTQLSRVAHLERKGEKAALYRLRYGADRSLLFAAFDDQLVVIFDPQMLLDASDTPRLAREQTAALEALLTEDTAFASAFSLAPMTATHRLTAHARALTLGYQALVPALAGMRAEFTKQGWQAHIALHPTDRDGAGDLRALWRAVPVGASLCAAAPLDDTLPRQILKRLKVTPADSATLLASLSGPAAICWYPDSRLFTPVVITQLVTTVPAEWNDAAARLFDSTVGTAEGGREHHDRFPVNRIDVSDGLELQRDVSSNFGRHTAATHPQPAQVNAAGYFRVSLARHGNTVAFSVDDTLTQRVQAVLEKRYAALDEQLPVDVRVPLYLAPSTLAPLLRDETLASLPQDEERLFRTSAERWLLPKLEKLQAHRSIAVTLPPTRPDRPWTWLPVQWTAL